MDWITMGLRKDTPSPRASTPCIAHGHRAAVSGGRSLNALAICYETVRARLLRYIRRLGNRSLSIAKLRRFQCPLAAATNWSTLVYTLLQKARVLRTGVAILPTMALLSSVQRTSSERAAADPVGIGGAFKGFSVVDAMPLRLHREMPFAYSDARFARIELRIPRGYCARRMHGKTRGFVVDIV